VLGRPPGEVDDRELRAEQVDGLVEVRAARDLLQCDDVRPQVVQQTPDHLVALPTGRRVHHQHIEGQKAHPVGHRQEIILVR
jgi:hypothetical protein